MSVPVEPNLALEVTKALVAPIAGLIGIVTAALLAVRGFRYQKLIERRLAWYEEMIHALTNAALAYDEATYREGAARDAENAENKALLLSFGAMMYADRPGAAAIERWVQVRRELPPPARASREDSQAFVVACTAAANDLMVELRKDLKLQRLPRAASDLSKVQLPKKGTYIKARSE